MNMPTNADDVIDSRDVIARIEELEGERDDHNEAVQDTPDALSWEKDPDYADDVAELKALIALQEQAEGYSDWHHGVTLIRDSYFKEYAQEYAEDVGAIQRDAAWPNSCIDWDQAARELQQDYTAVEFDGITYWVR